MILRFLSVAALVLAPVEIPSAKTIFPSVKDLEIAFHIYEGMQLSTDVNGNGVTYHTYYVKGKDLGNGYYDVTVKLDRQ